MKKIKLKKYRIQIPGRATHKPSKTNINKAQQLLSKQKQFMLVTMLV